MNPLGEYIKAERLPRYDAFDKAHRRDHIEYVIAESLNLSIHYKVDNDMARFGGPLGSRKNKSTSK